jgi:hypothetical protein
MEGQGRMRKTIELMFWGIQKEEQLAGILPTNHGSPEVRASKMTMLAITPVSVTVRVRKESR